MPEHVCTHEYEFGQIASTLENIERHNTATEQSIKELTAAVNEIKNALTQQGSKLDSVGSVRESVAGLSKQITDMAIDSKTSLKRAHERIDIVEDQIKQHNNDHCDDCHNKLGCEEAHKKVSDLISAIDPLLPFAKAVQVVRDKIIISMVIIIAVLAGYVALEVIKKQTGIIPTVISVEPKR